MQLFWSSLGLFSEQQSVRRGYPAGEVKAQFAFPNQDKGVWIEVMLFDYLGKAEILAFYIYCLP